MFQQHQGRHVGGRCDGEMDSLVSTPKPDNDPGDGEVRRFVAIYYIRGLMG